MTGALLLFLLLGAAGQSRDVCTGSSDYLDCRTAEGGTYIERRLGSSIVRQGTSSDGRTWTERVMPVFDGSRTEGTDSDGHRWVQRCSPKFGRTGTDRNGNAVFQPPRPAPAATAGQRTNLVAECD